MTLIDDDCNKQSSQHSGYNDKWCIASGPMAKCEQITQPPYTVSGHQLSTSETPFKWRFASGPQMARLYTETIKLRPLDVYVCQFQMYERISFKFSHYQL